MEINDEDLFNYIDNINNKNNKNNKINFIEENQNVFHFDRFPDTEYNIIDNKNYNIYKNNITENLKNLNKPENENKINFINHLIYTYKDDIKTLKKPNYLENNNNNTKRLKTKDINNILMPIFEKDKSKWESKKINEISNTYNMKKITIYKWNYNKYKKLNNN